MKNGANLLDRLVKDIVTESDIFDVEKFIPILKVRPSVGACLLALLLSAVRGD